MSNEPKTCVLIFGIFIAVGVWGYAPQVVLSEDIQRYGKLPTPQKNMPVHFVKGDLLAQRAVPMARVLVKDNAIPADSILIISNGFSLPEGLKAIAPPGGTLQGASSGRCGYNPATPDVTPTKACLYVDDQVLKEFSDAALLGILAHELGHVVAGHKADLKHMPSRDAQRAAEFEAEANGYSILHNAGLCGRAILRQTLLEMEKMYPLPSGKVALIQSEEHMARLPVESCTIGN
jgi:hypothetical protein